MIRSAKITVDNIFAGILSENQDGEYIFQYEPDYYNDASKLPVSLTLPKRKEPYVTHNLFPFFDGLIPEGWLLHIGIKNWKIDPNDRFGLLMHLCADCIGNVSVIAEEGK